MGVGIGVGVVFVGVGVDNDDVVAAAWTPLRVGLMSQTVEVSDIKRWDGLRESLSPTNCMGVSSSPPLCPPTHESTELTIDKR